MTVINKFRLEEPDTTIELPKDSDVLHVQYVDGSPHIWIASRRPANTRSITFRIVATESEFDDENLIHLGTFSKDNNLYHVFRVLDEEESNLLARVKQMDEANMIQY